MNQNNYYVENTNNTSRKKHLKQLLKRGLNRIKTSKKALYSLLIIITIEFIIWISFGLKEPESAFDALILHLDALVSIPFFIGLNFIYLIIIGSPMLLRQNEQALIRGGLCNSIGEPPLLVSKERITLEDYKDCTKLTYLSDGIPISEWIERKDFISSALNCHVISISQGNEINIVEVVTTIASARLETFIPWSDTFINPNDAIYILGKAIPNRTISYDTDKTPMILIAGSTGSGKSNLVKSQIRQAIERGTKVILIDKKYGLDYSSYFRNHCTLLTEDEEINNALKEMVKEMHTRFETIAKYDRANNVKELYENYNIKMQRILIVVDELAQITDHTGANKERKQLLDEIALSLSQISALARAVGINLILATQRPDQNVIPGIVKSNINIKICGIADENLSRIVFGDARAHEEIPKNIRGRFMLSDENHTAFQAFYYSDKEE